MGFAREVYAEGGAAAAAAAGDREKITQRWTTSSLTKKMDREGGVLASDCPPKQRWRRGREEAEGGRRVTVATHSA